MAKWLLVDWIFSIFHTATPVKGYLPKFLLISPKILQQQLDLKQHTYSKSTAEKLMNFFGETAQPFLFIIDFDCQNSIIIPLNQLDLVASVLKYQINGKLTQSTQKLYENVVLEKFPMPFVQYKKAFDFVQKNIKIGNSFLVNLTCQTPITLNISLQEVFERSNAKYKLWLKDKLVFFSPETFVKIDATGKISSFPMKGTIDANLPDAERILLNDTKELYEHTTIVDLIRNDLSRISEKVWVEKFRYIDKIKTQENAELLQVSSKISGLLSDNWKEKVGEIIFKMLPAGSISGAPKNKTIEIIKEAENLFLEVETHRNYYSGIFGVFDGTALDSGVMIRFIEQTPDGLVFKSGGGITANSIAEKEYEEMIQKIYVPII